MVPQYTSSGVSPFSIGMIMPSQSISFCPEPTPPRNIVIRGVRMRAF